MADRCPTCHRRKKRTNEANARYWLLLHTIADSLKPEGREYTPETWHTYFKSRYLGCDEFELPNKKTMQIPKSTADLDTAEFHDYATQVEAWAGEHDVWLDERPE